ncbi:hypothetical protein ABW19_dt0200676 [Dactylella cylindrospora]|nr:hypothetical protein ABW19_dt0200676 [Dactylella cylindrospora]
MPRSLPSKILIAFSSLFLAHACYSAHEHTSLTTAAPSTSTPLSSSSTAGQPPTGSSLPLDITLETLLSLALLLVGIVSDGWELKPISLRKYAGGLESGRLSYGLDAAAGAGEHVGVKGKGKGVYGFLEERAGFLDVRKQRKEFTEWVKVGELKSAMEG